MLDDQVYFIIPAVKGDLWAAIQQLIQCSQVPFEVVQLFTDGFVEFLFILFLLLCHIQIIPAGVPAVRPWLFRIMTLKY